MASNDGSRLTVFGLTFRQYDNRHMQQILRAYGQLPTNPGNRAALYTGLFDLSRDLNDDETQGIETWLQSGGNPDEFPTPRVVAPIYTAEEDLLAMSQSEDEYGGGLNRDADDDWQEYNPADFEDEEAVMDEIDHLRGSAEENGATEATIIDLTSERDGSDIDTYNPEEEKEIETDPLETEEEDMVANFDLDFPAPGIPGQGSDKIKNECCVCYNVMASADLLTPLKLTSTCNHDSDLRSCFSCIAEHIDSTVERFAINAINCPFCDETLSPDEIKKFASSETFAR